MRKVLIISYDYPPLNRIASRRFSEMIPYFNSCGWDPYVLTTVSTGDLPLNLTTKKIFRYTDHPHKNHASIPPLNAERNIFTRIRRLLGFNFRLLDKTCLKWSGSILNNNDLIKELKQIGFDVIVASYSPSAALWLGHGLSRRLSVPWIADFRDLGAQYDVSDNRMSLLVKPVDMLLEKHLLSTATALTTVSRGLAKVLDLGYRKDVAIIYNGWPIRQNNDFADVQLVSNCKENRYIYYAGSLGVHRLAAFRLLIDALRRVDISFKIRSLGPKDVEDKIKRYALECGIQDRLIWLPSASDDVVHLEKTYAYINLVVEELRLDCKGAQGALTGKFLSLLKYRAPVLAIARADSEISEVLKITKKGELVDSEQGVHKFIAQKNIEIKYKGDSSEIESYSKQNQAIRLCAFLDHSLARTSAQSNRLGR